MLLEILRRNKQSQMHDLASKVSSRQFRTRVWSEWGQNFNGARTGRYSILLPLFFSIQTQHRTIITCRRLKTLCFCLTLNFTTLSLISAPQTEQKGEDSISMGNVESNEDTSRDEYFEHPSYLAESSMDSHQPAHQSACVVDKVCHQRTKHQPQRIDDNFSSLDQVISALRDAGLESSNLILGIDFTKSNEWTGKYSFNRKSLHAIGGNPNPYEQAISIVGRTLSPFDEDNLIPCFGFGDASTHDKYVFNFFPEHRYCHGFEEVLGRYREIVPHLNLSGPTSFAPVIDAAIDIVEKSSGQYHVLVIIADGQVTRNTDTPPGRLSQQEQATINSIVAASHFPLSIILVGVGDGPWDAMHQFDDNIPHRTFDNFQFVDFTKIMSENKDILMKETAFALAALMEIPLQYKATQSLSITDSHNVGVKRARPLPPPREVIDHDAAVTAVKLQQQESSSDPIESTAPVEQVCPICLTNPKDMAFGCGHLTCKECGTTISTCPMCREPITTRLRLYA